MSLSDATSTPSAKAAMASVHPVQLGLGAKGGPERLAWTAQSVLARGGIVDTDDAVNAFNEIRRKSVLEAVSLRWPEGTQLFNKFYGLPSFALLGYSDEGHSFLRVILGQEGVRIGCPLGSFGFDLTADHFVYAPLAALYGPMGFS